MTHLSSSCSGVPGHLCEHLQELDQQVERGLGQEHLQDVPHTRQQVHLEETLRVEGKRDGTPSDEGYVLKVGET